MTAAADDAAAAFAGKWWQREPEMRVAATFCPPARRDVFVAWGAVLHELREAAFELSDARVSAPKCAWWAEELLGWSDKRSRHPLGRVLVAEDAPWAALGRAWLAWTDLDDRQGDTAAAITALMPAAAAVDAVEAALFAAPPARAGQGTAIAIHWLLHRLPHGLAAADRARLPMHLLARHGNEALQAGSPKQPALLADWARELLAAGAVTPRADTVFRRCRSAFDRARLDRLARGRTDAPAPLATLWRAWRAARGEP
jgi:hypothetical protein